MTWLDLAACRDTDPDTFYPTPPQRPGRGGGDYRHLYDKARTLCAQCPVRDQCLTAAMAEESPSERHGMRGGLTPVERGRLSLALRVAARKGRAA